jgi:hypothetical protein
MPGTSELLFSFVGEKGIYWLLKESVEDASLFARPTAEELPGIIRTVKMCAGETSRKPAWQGIGIERGPESGSLSAMEPDFPRNRFLVGIQKTICIYTFIRYYELHRVVQQELGHVKGEDLCVY